MIINLYKIITNDGVTKYFAYERDAKHANTQSSSITEVSCYYSAGKLTELSMVNSGARYCGINGRRIGKDGDEEDFSNVRDLPNGFYDAYYCWNTRGDTEYYAGKTTYCISIKHAYGSSIQILLYMTNDSFFAYKKEQELTLPETVIHNAITETKRQTEIARQAALSRSRLFDLKSTVERKRARLGTMTDEEETYIQKVIGGALSEIKARRLNK